MRLTLALAALVLLSPAAEAQVRLLGRYLGSPDAFTLQWSGAGFEATFTGKTFRATIDDWGESLYDVEVDGKRTTLTLSRGEKSYTLFDGAAGNHTIRVTRRTGINSGATKFSQLKQNNPKPTPAPSRRVLFIGDSITTGYGVEGANAQCAFSYATENANLGYAALAAKALKADAHLIAVDGFGLVQNYGGGAGPTMLALNRLTAPGTDIRWDPKNWQPQAVVINLGTNDFAGGDPGEKFDKAYVDFLTELRRDYPSAYLLATGSPLLTGPLQDDQRKSVREAVAVRKTAGDKNLGYIDLDMADDGQMHGCDWHPGRDSARGMGLAVQTELARVLGWTAASASDPG